MLDHRRPTATRAAQSVIGVLLLRVMVVVLVVMRVRSRVVVVRDVIVAMATTATIRSFERVSVRVIVGNDRHDAVDARSA